MLAGNLGSHKVCRDAGATLPEGAVPKRVDACSALHGRRCVRTQSGARDRCGDGLPACDPELLLKLCLYGCQHRVRRSRRLEAETRRNLEVIWRCQGAAPSCKTIADFRKSDASALRAANREFIPPCRELSLPEGRRVAVGGTFPKVNANADSIHAKASPAKGLKRLDQRIAECRRPLEEADAGPEDGADSAEDPELAAKTGALVERRKPSLRESLQASGERRMSVLMRGR